MGSGRKTYNMEALDYILAVEAASAGLKAKHVSLQEHTDRLYLT